MSAENKPKTPYSNYTIEEIMKYEQGKFVIQVGSDFLTSDTGKMAFEQKRAEELYTQVWEGLEEMKNSEDLQERKDAIMCLEMLRIIPLRIH
jgi:replicative superfamily II helicase